MAGRRVLIIGSQCEVEGRLSFLPELAHRLHELMTTGPGGCAGVPLRDGRPDGLLIDPTVAETKDAIGEAIQGAAAAGETLAIAYLGHGQFRDKHFFLMPTDASERPTSRSAVHLANFIAEILEDYPGFPGLTVLIDACYAGMGAEQAMAAWADVIEGLTGFELLTATDDNWTAGGLLFQTLIRMLERGDPKAGLRLTCLDVFRQLGAAHRPAQQPAFNADSYLGRNPARDPGEVFWKDVRGRDSILQQTWNFQPTVALRRLVEASQADPVVVTTGPAGVGKSTLASSLVRPELTAGMVPEGFVQAISLLTRDSTEIGLADDLAMQLGRTVPGFAEAVQKFYLAVTIEERKRLDHISLKALRPLAYLPEDAAVRIVLDGYDQLSIVLEGVTNSTLQGWARRC